MWRAHSHLHWACKHNNKLYVWCLKEYYVGSKALTNQLRTGLELKLDLMARTGHRPCRSAEHSGLKEPVKCLPISEQQCKCWQMLKIMNKYYFSEVHWTYSTNNLLRQKQEKLWRQWSILDIKERGSPGQVHRKSSRTIKMEQSTYNEGATKIDQTHDQTSVIAQHKIISQRAWVVFRHPQILHCQANPCAIHAIR